ncbi:Cullin binding-domain-containing protein [Helicostylum pulchrum]|nr:Cullin binding-domain-containing protein [Helicostylum pulchrum]
MPPKRKAATTINETVIVPRRLKIAKKKQTTALAKTFNEKSKHWFEKYTDADNRELIGPDGCQAFFNDIGVSLESALPLVIGYKMKSIRMGYITWEEWLSVMKPELYFEEDGRFALAVLEWERSIMSNEEEYKQFYLFSFNYAKSNGQKSMDIETATAIWHIILEKKYPIVKSFIEFVQVVKPVQVINKDQWSSMLDFCKAVPEDLQNYDSTSSCKHNKKTRFRRGK